MDDEIGGRSINFRGVRFFCFRLYRKTADYRLRRRVERTVRSARSGQGGNTRRPLCLDRGHSPYTEPHLPRFDSAGEPSPSPGLFSSSTKRSPSARTGLYRNWPETLLLDRGHALLDLPRLIACVTASSLCVPSPARCSLYTAAEITSRWRAAYETRHLDRGYARERGAVSMLSSART